MRMFNLIIYWTSTIIAAFTLAVSGLVEFFHYSQMIAVIRQLGYPDYLLSILGIAKILGVFVLLNPKPSRLKEWAYAGFTFVLIGASLSYVAMNLFQVIVVPLSILGILLISYISYHLKKTKVVVSSL